MVWSLLRALSQAASSEILPSDWSACSRPEWGDLSCKAALRLARSTSLSPTVLAQEWARSLTGHPWVTGVTPASGGYLNVLLSPAGWDALLDAMQTPPSVTQVSTPERVLVEFVSANPTGPLHVGHARQAALGDALVQMLRARGHAVSSEFFYNDAGTQVDHLVRSVQARWAEAHGRAVLRFARDGVAREDCGPLERWVPEDAYHGTYVIDLASALPPPATRADAEPSDDAVRGVVLPIVQKEQKASLARFGIAFDGWVSETDLHCTGAVSGVVNRWAQQGRLYFAEGKAWLETRTFGDDKDRVVQKPDGTTTYFVPDVAYHRQKWLRGYTRALNVQGSDHHGTLMRVRAGLQALDEGIPAAYPDVRFHTMVKVVNNGVPLPTSKRAGGYTTLDELLDALDPTALRLLLLRAKPESELVLDLAQALVPSAENPAYSIQYAHARACALLDRLSDQEAAAPMKTAHGSEKKMLLAQVSLLLALDRAVMREEPHAAVEALSEFSRALHAAYQQGPRAHALPPSQQALRHRLFTGARAALVFGAGLVGAALPERMVPRPSEHNDAGERPVAARRSMP